MDRKVYLVFILLTFGLAQVFAQETIIKGKVIDNETGEGIPFAVVFYKGTKIATQTDFDGKYTLKSNSPKDSLVAQYIGYKTANKKVIAGTEQTINFRLKTDAIVSQEVTVYAGENPAYAIMRKVIANKPKNDRRSLESYEYDCYNKVELDVDNISKRLRNIKIAKKVFKVLDSIQKINDEDGRTILPIFISETMSRYYYKENPTMRKEVVRASKVTGIGVDDGSFIAQLMGSSFQQYNFYKSWVSILQKDFVSPIADSWKLYYEYYLADSLYIGEDRCWEIEIQPRRPQDLAFTGRIWVNMSDYALRRIDLTIGRDANINFIEKIKIQQDFAKTEAGPYLANKTRFVVDLADLSDSTAGMIMKFYSSNKDFVINKPKDTKFFDQSIEMLETANMQDEKFWNENRHDPISESEKKIFQMVDTLRHLPVLKNYIEVLNILVNGYKRVGKVDIGPYLLVYTYNTHPNDDSHNFYGEGHRFRLGFRTNYHFSKKIVFSGYGAYGTLDKTWKYGTDIKWIINRKPWTTLSIESKYDINQVGLIGFGGQPGLFRAFLSWGRLVRPFYQFNNAIHFETEIVKDLSQKITLLNSRFDPLYKFGYYDPENPRDTSTIYNNLKYSEVILETRYARDETFLQNENDRISLGTRAWPIFTFRYTLGIKDVLGSQFNYHKFNAMMSHDLRIGIFGRMTYIITGGYIPSNVPYPLLENHLGNNTIFSNINSYNLMRFSEFSSDRYASLTIRHHFEGFFFNKVPLFSKLKWREVATVKMLWGMAGKRNLDLNPREKENGNYIYPGYNSLNPNVPYIEVGYSIENIFKFIRVDFIHRLTYLENNKIYDFGPTIPFAIKLSAQFRL